MIGYCQSLLPPNLLQQQVYCTHIHLQTRAGSYRLITLNEIQQPGLTSWKFKLSKKHTKKTKQKIPKTTPKNTQWTKQLYFHYITQYSVSHIHESNIK